MSKLFLIRHGEPSLRGVLLGRLNPGLSEEGKVSAAMVLSGQAGAIAYVSPLERARQTAAHLPGEIPRVVLDDLAEVSQGEWEGRRWDEVTATHPEIARRKLERWFAVPAPGGEAWLEVTARAGRALERIRQGPRPVIVVAHQGINAALHALLTGEDPHGFTQAYCEVFEYEL